MRRSCTSCALATSGLILTILGIIIIAAWPSVFDAILQKQLSLTPDSESYKPWKTPAVTLNLDIYLFNWTNPEDLTNTSTKPIMEQLGPYRFREVPDKENITWHPENNTVSFRKKADFFFDPEGSVGSLDDEITTVNVVALAAGHQAHNWPTLQKSAVNMGMGLYGEERHVTKRVQELLFDGFEDPLIDMARSMPSLTGGGAVPFDKFGWFYTRNGSSHLTGHFNMATGADDMSKIGRVERWNYADHLPFFEKECAGVDGSSGTFYPPGRSREDPVWLFSPDMCRKLRFDYEKDVMVKDVLGYKYTGGDRTVDNGTLYPENECFCNGECVPSGVMNISACRYGTPVFMSFPHFYKADPYYLDAVEGLEPSQDKHGFHIVLEPTTGIPLDVAARFQVNILMAPHPGINLYNKVPRVFMPVLWFEHRITIPDATAANILSASKAPWAGRLCGYILLGLGISIMVIMQIRELIVRKNDKDKNKSGSYAVTSSRMAPGTLELVPPAEKESATPLMNGQKH